MKVVISPNPYRDKQFRCALKVRDVLEGCGIHTTMCLPFDVDKSYELPADIKLSKLDDVIDSCDIFVALGGDGTILHASRLVAEKNIPILGINVGTLGFMAELESTDLHLLKKLAVGDYHIEVRMMLDVTVTSGGKQVFHEHALNDAVITKGAVARVLQMNVTCSGSEVMSCSGDGIILATPTGSTAYSLSAGGPIVEPTASNILITPICAHGSNFRSFVTNPASTIAVSVDKIGRRNAFLSVDGGRAFRLDAGDTVTVSRSSKQTKLIKLKEFNFFETVNRKFYNR